MMQRGLFSIVVLLALGIIGFSYGDSASDALAEVTSLLNDPSLDQKYKDYLKTSVKSGSGVTKVSSTAAGRFSAAARYSGTANTKCGAWCCGQVLTPQTKAFTRTVTKVCSGYVTEYFRTRKCFFCSWKTRSRSVKRTHVCYTSQTFYRTVIPTCPLSQYTRCCAGHVFVFDCCIDIEGLLAIVRLIEALAQLGVDPLSAGGVIFQGKAPPTSEIAIQKPKLLQNAAKQPNLRSQAQ